MGNNRRELRTNCQKMILARERLQIDFLPAIASMVDILVAKEVGVAVLPGGEVSESVLFPEPRQPVYKQSTIYIQCAV